jgi:hypothetical protein
MRIRQQYSFAFFCRLRELTHSATTTGALVHTLLSFTVLMRIPPQYSSVRYCRLLHSCTYDNSTLPYSIVLQRSHTHTTTVLLRTMLSFTVLMRIRQQYSFAFYCRLLHSCANDNSTLLYSAVLQRSHAHTTGISCTILSFTVLMRIRQQYSSVRYCRLMHSCANDNSTLPYSAFLQHSHVHTTTALFRTILLFTVLMRIRQQYSFAFYCRLRERTHSATTTGALVQTVLSFCRIHTHTTTVLLRTILCFTVLMRIQQH